MTERSPNRYGTLNYQIGDTTLTLPITDMRLRDRKLIVTGRIEVQPGEPDVTIPAEDWPCLLVGEDGAAVYASTAHFDGDSTVSCRDFVKVPASLTVVQPFGDPGMQAHRKDA